MGIGGLPGGLSRDSCCLIEGQNFSVVRHEKHLPGAIDPRFAQTLSTREIHDEKKAVLYQKEANIHAGVKYIRFMVDKYFANEPMDDTNKILFAFAAYNASPGRIHSLREEAAKKGLNPNVRVENVELVAAARIGMETVTYVANIYKYYIAYKLVAELEEERKRAKEALENGP